MQNQARTRRSLEVKPLPIFIFLDEEPVNQSLDNVIEQTEILIHVREINGVDKTEDEIVEEAWMRIRNKILEYQLLPNHLQRFRDDPVVEQRTDQQG